MKFSMKTMFKFAAGLALIATLASCNNNKDEEVAPIGEQVIEGNITTNTELDANVTYLLRGQVIVTNGATLKIPAGTLIKGERRTKGTLVIDKGAKIDAQGTAQNPIVMTSSLREGERDRGDWGGVVILGRANTNQQRPTIEGIVPEINYGTFQSTEFDGENSGIMRYVRIEYAGIELSPNNETNSLTMGGVGRGTTIEYVQVSFGGDDGFEWFGGTVDGKYLISHAMWDDDLDCDFGWTGRVQFVLVVRNPSFADQSGSNAFECDNDASGSTNTPFTAPVFSNVTVYGPREQRGRSISNNYQHAMHLRRRTATSIFNSVLVGFPTMFRLDGITTEEQYTSGAGAIENTVIVGIAASGSAAATMYSAGSGNTAASVETYFTAAARNNQAINIGTTGDASPDYNALGLRTDNFVRDRLIENYPKNPNFALTSANATLASGGAFTNAKVNNSFFQNVSYRGAFGTTDWTDGWADFRPGENQY